MIIKESDSRKTLLTIVNYEVFQDSSDSYEDSHMTVIRTVSGQSQGQSQGTNNNDKECIKNEKNNNRGTFVPPTLDDVITYCQERNNHIDPQTFIDFYSSKGWMIGKNKMKDWKAAVRTWEHHDNEPRKKTPQYKQFEHNNEVSDLEKELLAN